MHPDQRRKKILRIIAITLAAILALIALAVVIMGRAQPEAPPQDEIDFIPEAFFDYKTQANIVGGDVLLDYFVHWETVDALTRDLHTFGRAAYDAYKNDGAKPVGFKITPPIIKENDIITFGGRYGSSENKVAVEVKLLNSKRMDISITDIVTGFNMDDKLPSNSKVNHFIGSLPIFGDGYNITYVSGNTINIGLYFRDPNLRDSAYQTIIDKLGEEEAQKLDITVSFPMANANL